MICWRGFRWSGRGSVPASDEALGGVHCTNTSDWIEPRWGIGFSSNSSASGAPTDRQKCAATGHPAPMRLDGRVQEIVSSRWQRPTIIGAPIVTRSIETDYLVVGAGAMGMAFTDALIDHADVHVTLVDRRHAAGGHWQDAYPFVQLHQASLFYGVASTVLGTGAVQQRGAGGGAAGAGPSVGDPGVLRRHPASPLRRLGPRHVPRRERVPRPTAPVIS